MILQGKPQSDSEENEFLREKERRRKRDLTVNFLVVVVRFHLTMLHDESLIEAL